MIPEYLQEAVQVEVDQSTGECRCVFKKDWAMIWPELSMRIEDYKSGKIHGGTSWFFYDAPTPKEAFDKFFQKIRCNYLLCDDGTSKVIFVK